jgi:site-specific recombinase XerD
MSEGVIAEEEWASGLAAVVPSPERNPVGVYLARLAPGSRRAMRQALGHLAALAGVAEAERFPWHLLRYPHTQAMRARVAARYAPASANKVLCALRGVLGECFRLGLMSAEERLRAADVASVRGERLPRGRALTAGELRALFHACDATTACGARDAALLGLLYGAGLRRAEAVSITLSDLDLATGTLRVTGKGDKQRAVPLGASVCGALERWLRVRGSAAGRLFAPVRKGDGVALRPMSGQAVLMILRRLAARCGVARFSPHDARRTFISDLLDAGADLSTVQQLAGHAQVTTTARYDRRGEHAKRRAVGLLHVPVSE